MLFRRPHVHVANYSTSLLHLERRTFAVRGPGGIGWELQSEMVIDMVHDGEVEGFTPTAVNPELQWLPRYLDPGPRSARIMGDLAAAFTCRAGGN